MRALALLLVLSGCSTSSVDYRVSVNHEGGVCVTPVSPAVIPRPK